MIKAVLFDLGRVIVPFDFNRGYSRLEKLSGIPAADIPKRLGETDLVQRFESGLIEPRDFVAQVAAHFGAPIGHDEFCDIWNCIFLPETLIPESMLAGIAARYRLVLLSNTNPIHFEGILRNYRLLRHFHAYVVSYKVGVMKPGARIYEAAVAAARCQPGECFFTDDIAEYVEGARRAGIDAIQFRSADQIRAELHMRGVEWEEPAS